MPDEKPVYRDPIDPLPNGLVRPKGRRKQSKKERRKREISIAAALGKGGALREIAAETGHSKTMVVHVRDKIDDGKDAYLAKVRERARNELAELAIDALKPTIVKMKAKLEDDNTRLSDMAQSARALNEIAFPMQEAEPLKAPLGDMARLSGSIAAELIMKLREVEQKPAEKEVEGERID